MLPVSLLVVESAGSWFSTNHTSMFGDDLYCLNRNLCGHLSLVETSTGFSFGLDDW